MMRKLCKNQIFFLFFLILGITSSIFAGIPTPDEVRLYSSVTMETEYGDFCNFSYSELIQEAPDGEAYYEVGLNQEGDMVLERHYNQEHALRLLRYHRQTDANIEVFSVNYGVTPPQIIQFQFSQTMQPVIFRFFNVQQELLKVKMFHSNGHVSRIVYRDPAKGINKQDEYYSTHGQLELIEFYDKINGRPHMVREEIYEQNALVEYSVFLFSDEGEPTLIKTYNSDNELIATSEPE